MWDPVCAAGGPIFFRVAERASPWVPRHAPHQTQRRRALPFDAVFEPPAAAARTPRRAPIAPRARAAPQAERPRPGPRRPPPPPPPPPPRRSARGHRAPSCGAPDYQIEGFRSCARAWPAAASRRAGHSPPAPGARPRPRRAAPRSAAARSPARVCVGSTGTRPPRCSRRFLPSLPASGVARPRPAGRGRPTELRCFEFAARRGAAPGAKAESVSFGVRRSAHFSVIHM